MKGAVDFDDEPHARSEKISDESRADWYLAAERNTELTRVERGPKPRFGLGERAAMLTSEEFEPSSGLRMV